MGVPTQPVPLGPFDLLDPLGKGGMGRVWRGRHRAQGVEVAVKVLHAARVEDAAFRRAFDAEVQSVLALDHPGIVLVHDHGVVPPETGEASRGKVPAGSPYLVMELARGGSLADLPNPLQWKSLRAALRSILDALAHAHARGVVHRDIKRSNVLIGLAGDSRPGLKLSDFGLVHRLSELSGVRGFETEAVGTPNYMAPEQVQARWRDYGPWTDLYALGCLGWSLATGRPPYRGTPVEVMAAHVRSELGAFHPGHDLPAGFEGWLRRLMAKKEWRRFACAADAIFALDALDGTEVPEGIPLQVGGAVASEQTAVELTTRSWTVPPLPVHRAARDRDVDEAPSPLFRPKFPASWQPPRIVPAAPRLLGVGLGVFGLRRARFVGRESLRQALWDELKAVDGEARARAVILDGAPGAGTSRVARWLAERAAEMGVAQVVRVLHGPGAGPRAGLGPAVERLFGLKGLDRDACLGRIGRLLRRLDGWDAELVVELTELVRPRHPDAIGRSRASRGRHHRALARLLETYARRRPVVVWIEDLAWSPDGIAFVEALLQRQSRTPSAVLVLATFRPGEADAAADDDIARLAAREDCRRLEVGPLPEGAAAELVADLLGLAPDLARHVLDRASGNPLFARLLVGDWVQRGVLVPGGEGFELRDGAHAELPDDLHELWLRRVDGTLADDDAALALEVAATLGESVHPEEWGAALDEAELDVDEDEILAAVTRGGLVRPAADGDGWELVHGMLAESLLRRARDAGRLGRWHRACAAALTRLPAGDPSLRAARLGRHWLEAGDTRAAIGPLLQSAGWKWRSGDCAAALAAVGTAEQAAAEASVAADDRVRSEIALAHADALAASGRIADAGRVAEKVVAAAEAGGWPDLEAAARIHDAMARMREHRFEEALVVLEQALTLYLVEEDGPGMVEAGRLLARCLGACGRLPEAIVRGRAALAAAEALGDPVARAEVLVVLGGLQKRAGKLPEAERLCSAAASVLGKAGHRARLAEVWLVVADVRRRRGDLDGAAAMLERSRDVWSEAGSLYVGAVDINLALVDIERGRFEDAVARLLGALPVADAEDDRFVAFSGRAMLVRALASLDRFEELERTLTELEAWPPTLASEDTAGTVEEAGDVAAREDRRALAVRCWTSALRQWEQLGLRNPVLRVTVKIDEISLTSPS